MRGLTAETEPDRCDCGGTLSYDPTVEGVTLGGLSVAGGDRCGSCGRGLLSERSVPAGPWTIAKSGVSVDAGEVRLRADGGDRERTTALMARIARLPDLEAALRRIARGEADAVGVARAALEAGR